jgi:hypothetical protein
MSSSRTETVWKMIYLARRNPGLRAEDFPQAWREHSALGKQCHNVAQRVRSVAQCSRLLNAPLPGAAQDYDGVNLLVLADREAATAIWNDPETLAVMKPDEPRVFDRYVREFSLVCREQVLRDMPRSKVVLHGFLRRRPDLSAASFRLSWIAASPASQLLRGPLGAALRVVHNQVVVTPPAGYEYDAIVEWWFESEQELSRAVNRQDLRSLISPSLARLLDLPGSVFMATRVTHARP